MHVVSNYPISPEPDGVIVYYEPLIIFTVRFGLEKNAAAFRYTRLAFGSKIEQLTYVICQVAPEVMQNERDIKCAFEQIEEYYTPLGPASNFRYMEKGCVIDPRAEFPLKPIK